ncbi:MAG: DUF309 domain-containing protein [Chloroflexi bacterium]|nr:DUF309 domain-containing protein [Chloroflexota bacterium]
MVRTRSHFRSQRFASRRRLVARLVQYAAAALFVDSALPDWPTWLTLPKASPATRRIPLFLISEDSEARAESFRYGADFAFSSSAILAEAPTLLTDFARAPSSETLAALDCACQGALPPLAQEGIAQFNAGQYYRQHDLFEELWMTTPGPERDLYRAILQVGVAYYQIERGNWRGAYKMLLRSVQWLHWLPPTCQGIDVASLRRDSTAVRATLERLGEAQISAFDRQLLRPVRWRKATDSLPD